MTGVAVAIVLSDKFDLCRETVGCVLGQDGVDVEIMLFGSCRKIGSALSADSRVSFYEVQKPPAYSELLQKLANDSSARYVMCLNANNQLLPGALAALLKELDTDSGAEMVCALHFAADQEGNINRHAYHTQWETFDKLRNFDPASPKDLFNTDFLLEGIKIMRRQSLLSRIFSGHMQYTTYSLVWSLHSLLSPRFLRRPLSISKGSLPLKKRSKLNAGDFLARTVSLLARDQYPGKQFSTAKVMVQACRFYWSKSGARRTFLHWQLGFQRWLKSSGLEHALYRSKVAILQKLPLLDQKTISGVDPGPKKVGYYLWQYPVHSQTFVQRELAALCRSGNDIVVFSEIEPEDEYIAALKPVLAATARVVPACTGEELRLIRRRFFRSHPVRFLRIYLYVTGQRYHVIKNRRFDEMTFESSLKLAALAEQHGIRHLHAPWADNCAFIALLASRMLGISYSVQARAHDIHRNSYKYGLRQKFEHAEFVISNTVYNVNHIRSILSPGHSEKVRHIYNGLNLEQFDVRRKPGNDGSDIKLLCVARLIEQKGLIYLLQACRRLLDSGLNLRCDIVGGVEEICMNYYVRLARLHRALGLENNVHFSGSLSFEEVLASQKEADIFVLPCVLAEDGSRDIIPNSVLEAMAMKLPVVSTTITGLPEMVDSGKTGYLVPPGDVVALAGAIRELADSPKLRYEFGKAGRQRVEQLFDSKKNVLEYQRLFSGCNPPGN